MTKANFRKVYLTRRDELSLNEVDEKSLNIVNQTLNLPIWNGSVYSIFLSISGKKEVNTEYLLNILHGKDKNITVSKSLFKSYEMKHYLLTDNTQIKVNSWGIPEPVDGIEISPEQMDVVFVPLLVFDKNGNRIGYGKGFYDRFLAKTREDTIKIGLSFFAAEAENIPTGASDISLDYCVTPDKIYEF